MQTIGGLWSSLVGYQPRALGIVGSNPANPIESSVKIYQNRIKYKSKSGRAFEEKTVLDQTINITNSHKPVCNSLLDIYNRKEKLAHWISKVNTDLSEPDKTDVLKCICHMQDNENSSLWIINFITNLLSLRKKLNKPFRDCIKDDIRKLIHEIDNQNYTIKTREAKDRYIDSNFKNFLEEISTDLANYGTDIILRKLLLSSISLQIAQNIGIDYHASTEELYYYMRKNEQNTNQHMIRFIDSFYEKIMRKNK